MRPLPLIAGIALAAVAAPASADPFSFMPPGDLAPGSGQGRADDTVYAPGILFPIDALAYANSQVWGHGGSEGPGGSQCDAVNYAYPWRDNYCETRSWDMPLCPAGTGHQGQDIRPETCENLTHWVLAVSDGTITNIGSYSIYLTAPDGTRFDYLHSGNIQVVVGQEVKRGDRLSQVSNEFGGTPTTIHLHFNIRQNVDGVGSVYVPPYLSLVAAYQAFLDPPPLGELEEVSCDAIRGWAFDAEVPGAPAEVTLRFETPLGALDAAVTADVARPDPCDSSGSCDHGFAPLAPLSLFDGQEHAVHALVGASDLAASPMPMQCGPIALDGTRRPLGDDAVAGWAFDPFWDAAPVDPGELAALPEGGALDDEPELVADGGAYWLLDSGARRAVSEAALAAWRFDAAAAALPPAGFEDLPVGRPLGDRPVLARDARGALWLLDGLDIVAGAGPADQGAGAAAAGDGGCACRTRGEGRGMLGWLVMIAALAITRLRRGFAPAANKR